MTKAHKAEALAGAALLPLVGLWAFVNGMVILRTDPQVVKEATEYMDNYCRDFAADLRGGING